jgi:hypothetical protein
MDISQRTYVEVDHGRAPARHFINPYGSSAWITSACSATLKSVEAEPGLAGEGVNMYGSTAWVRGGTSPAQKVESARLAGVAGEFFNPYGSTAWVRGGPSKAAKTETARLSGLAGEFINPFGSTAWVRHEPSVVMLSQEDMAEAVQLQALAGGFWPGISQAEMAAVVRLHALAGGFESSETTIAARLVAVGKAFGIIPHYISVELVSFSNQ